MQSKMAAWWVEKSLSRDWSTCVLIAKNHSAPALSPSCLEWWPVKEQAVNDG
jgi:hypothetical protein